MLRTMVLLLVGGLFGLGATVTAAVAPIYMPNIPSWAVHWLFWGGIALVGLMVIDAALIFFWAGSLRENWLQVLSINVGALLIFAGVIFHHAPTVGPLAEVSLPGLGIFAAIEIRDVAEIRRKYIFDVGTSDGAKAAFYLSASDKFTFVITDTRGETYPLEFPTTGKTLVIGQPVYLLLECGIIDLQTKIHAVINGYEVVRRTLPFPINLGARDWKDITVGANKAGRDGGAFVLAEFGIVKTTLNKDDFERMKTYYREKYNLDFR